MVEKVEKEILPQTRPPRRTMKDGFGLDKIDTITKKMAALSLSGVTPPVSEEELPTAPLAIENKATDTSEVKHLIPSEVNTIIGYEGVRENASEPVSGFTALPLRVKLAEGVRENTSEVNTSSTTEGVRENTSEVNTSSTTEGVRENTSEGVPLKMGSRGLSPAQKPVLEWLAKECNGQTKIITYKTVSKNLGITLCAARTHIGVLHDKGLIHTQIAIDPGTKNKIGKHITVLPAATLALALSQAAIPSYPVRVFTSEVNTSSTTEGVRENTSEVNTNSTTEGMRENTSMPHSYCSSSILKTTTTSDAVPQENFQEMFDQLILDDWEQWGLRPATISRFLSKPLSLLQEILDKSAYAIRARESSAKPIDQKIGFLVANLTREFCDVDSSFISREEKLIKQRMEAREQEIKRLKVLKEQDREQAIELLSLQLSSEEMKEIRQQAVDLIRKEMKQPTLNPGDTLVAPYVRNILAEKAKEKGLF